MSQPYGSNLTFVLNRCTFKKHACIQTFKTVIPEGFWSFSVGAVDGAHAGAHIKIQVETTGQDNHTWTSDPVISSRTSSQR